MGRYGAIWVTRAKVAAAEPSLTLTLTLQSTARPRSQAPASKRIPVISIGGYSEAHHAPEVAARRSRAAALGSARRSRGRASHLVRRRGRGRGRGRGQG